MHKLIEQLKRHEGFKCYPEYCLTGKLIIGYGRDLEQVGIKLDEAEILLANDLNVLLLEMKQYIKLSSCNPARSAALVNLAYLLGVNRFLTFTKVIAHIENNKFQQATNELLNCLQARYLPRYTAHLLLQLESGQWQ